MNEIICSKDNCPICHHIADVDKMVPPPQEKWEEKLRNLWQTTRENEGKYEKVKAFFSHVRREAVEERNNEFHRLFLEEIIIADKEGIPTSRLMSLYTRFMSSHDKNK